MNEGRARWREGKYGYQDGQRALGHLGLHAAVVDEEEEAPAGWGSALSSDRQLNAPHTAPLRSPPQLERAPPQG